MLMCFGVVSESSKVTPVLETHVSFAHFRYTCMYSVCILNAHVQYMRSINSHMLQIDRHKISRSLRCMLGKYFKMYYSISLSSHYSLYAGPVHPVPAQQPVRPAS